MKKLFLFLCLSALCTQTQAQREITGNSAPVKLSDVIARYKTTHPDYGKKEYDLLKNVLPGLPKEDDDKDYQFSRWVWYWQQHLDANGYIVSPVKNWQEWEKQQQNNGGSGAKTTASTAPLGNWSFQGPDSSGAFGSGVGRINVIAFHPTSATTFWIGSPGGGAWKTTNNGATWTSMTDNLPSLSVTAIVFNPKNANTMYLGTGDRDGDDYYGIGLLKSTNGGTSWNTTGLAWTPSQYDIVNALLINPTDTNSLILAATDGIYKSFNGGATFTHVLSGNNFMQLVYNPTDTNVIYATTYYNYGTGANAQIWRSANAGSTWTQVSTFTSADRVAIAVTPANANIVMAVVSSLDPSNTDGLDGIYKSTDGGTSFTEIFTGGCTGNNNLLSFNPDGSGCGGQGFYDLPIAISATNANEVYMGGVNSWNSTDGGVSWNIMNQWADYSPGVAVIHADKHFMGFNSLNGDFYESNDGGIYSTTSPLSSSTWNNLTNGLGIEEVYRTAVSNSVSANYELLGAQDVGSKLVKPSFYQDADGGDGMECHIDPITPTVGYTSIYNGTIDILDPISSLSPNDISGNILGGSIEGTGGWITPYILEPSCHNCILAGYAAIYKSMDEGNTWSTISPALTSGNLLRVVTTEADSNTIYAADDGSNNLYYTHNMGSTWTTLTAPYSGAIISDVKVDPRDKNHIWVSFSGYGSPEIVQWNLSTGWATLNTGLPDVPVNCIAIDTQNRDLYIGTDIGVYFMDTTMTSWVPYTYHMPVVRANDLQINYATNEIWAATYGRSLWKSGKHLTTSSASGVSVVPFVLDGIIIAPNPSHGDFTVTVNNITDKQVKMELLDLNGKNVWSENTTLNGNQVQVSIKNIASGTYIFQIATQNGIAGRQKIVIY